MSLPIFTNINQLILTYILLQQHSNIHITTNIQNHLFCCSRILIEYYSNILTGFNILTYILLQHSYNDQYSKSVKNWAFLLLQRWAWGGQNWELMQYSSFITKFTDTAHLRDQIQVWREILQKFPWKITGRRSWEADKLHLQLRLLASTPKTYYNRSELLVNLDWITIIITIFLLNNIKIRMRLVKFVLGSRYTSLQQLVTAW